MERVQPQRVKHDSPVAMLFETFIPPYLRKDFELSTDESNRPDRRRSRTSKTDNNIKGKTNHVPRNSCYGIQEARLWRRNRRELFELHIGNVFIGDIRSQECLQDKRSFDQLEKVVTYNIRT